MASVAFLGVFACTITGCSDVPSLRQIRAAAAKIATAPTPANTGLDSTPDPTEEMGDPVTGTNAFVSQLCSDASCPFVHQWYLPLSYPSLAEACAALYGWSVRVGGPADGPCLPQWSSRAEAGSAGQSTWRNEFGVLVIDDGQFGNTIIFEVTYRIDEQTTPTDDPVTLRLGIGQQFCSDSSIADACTDDS